VSGGELNTVYNDRMTHSTYVHGYALRNVKRCPTYESWKSMRKRCNNPRATRYERYGGRGIKVCARWDSFVNFLADMGEMPLGHSIERLDRDGDYTPENCIWIPRNKQQANRSMCHRVTFNGKTQTYADWERELGLYKGAIYSRLSYGWSLEKALTTPLRGS
jgi:hypothetical protein